MRAVADTSVISNFAAIGQLDLLRRIFGSLFVPLEVYEEIRAGLDEGYTFYQGVVEQLAHQTGQQWLELTGISDGDEIDLYRSLPGRLHAGEASCLAIARNRQWLLLTDDQAARQQAAEWGLVVSGSIGCLVAAVERGEASLDVANAWLSRMIAHGYRSPVTDLSVLVKDSKEHG